MRVGRAQASGAGGGAARHIATPAADRDADDTARPPGRPAAEAGSQTGAQASNQTGAQASNEASPAGAPASPTAAAAGLRPGPSRGGRAAAGGRRWLRRPGTRATGGHLLLIACFIGAGIGVTWPVTASLSDGRVPLNSDVSSYVWSLWWMAHQVANFTDPWFTLHMAAPVGVELGFDTLMPLPGLVMTPVTLIWGPAASFAVLTIAVPGLLCYVTYRAARLWLGQAGSIAAGALLGLSTMVTWQDLFHLNISVGTLFLPLTLETAIRLKRRPGLRQGIVLGVVLGASVLTNQESAVIAALLAVAILLPWLIRQLVHGPGGGRAWRRLGPLGLGVLVAAVLASPQLIVMIRQEVSGGATVAPQQATQLTDSYTSYGVGLPTLFAPSPRIAHFHVHGLAAAYHYTQPAEGVPTFGVVLAGLAVLGLVLCWRRRQLRWLGLLWLVGAALALGPTLIIGSKTYVPWATHWKGDTVSWIMPYTWLIRIPGLAALREADRLALLGLLGAAILAGAAIEWLCRHARPVVAVPLVLVLAAAAFFEAGWSASGYPTMPTAMPGVDNVIANAGRANSIVVDVPFGLRGGVGTTGFPLPPQALMLATADGHPRAVAYTSWVPQQAITGISRIYFYRFLYKAQGGAKFPGRDGHLASSSARHHDIRWVVVWRLKVAMQGHKQPLSVRKSIYKYLFRTGFRPVRHVSTAEATVTVWHRRG